MPKWFLRIVSLILIPCFPADSLPASVLPSAPLTAQSLHQNCLTNQALSLVAGEFRESLKVGDRPVKQRREERALAFAAVGAPPRRILAAMQLSENTELAPAVYRTTLLRIPLLRALELLKDGVRVFNPLSGIDLSAGLFGNQQWTVNSEIPEPLIRKGFSRSSRYFNEKAFPGQPFFPPDVMARLGPLNHSEMNVLEKDLAALWRPFMRSGDLVFLKFTLEYLLSWDASDYRRLSNGARRTHEQAFGRLKDWLNHFVDSLPDGMNVMISEHSKPWPWPSILDGAPGLAAYLLERGGFECLEPELFSLEERVILESLNNDLRLTADFSIVPFKDFEFGVGGSIHFLRRNRAAPSASRSSLSAA